MTDDPRFVFLHRLAQQGGPVPEEDARLTATIAELYAELQAGTIPSAALKALHAVLPFTRDTIQGFTFLKPNGYAGCYEVEHLDPKCAIDAVPNTPRRSQTEFALSNSFGFGGHNVSLLFRR